MSAPLMLDLYCGIGLNALGYAQAGFDVAAIDIDAVALSVLRTNLPTARALQADLLQVGPGECLARLRLSAHEVVHCHASTDCRLHSKARGQRQEIGPGHDQLLSVIRWARALPNATVSLENVVEVRRSPHYPPLVEALRRERDVGEFILDAIGWVPQTRRRLFICAGAIGKPCIAPPIPMFDRANALTFAWAMDNSVPIAEIEDGRILRLTDWQLRCLPFVPEGGNVCDVTQEELRAYLDLRYHRNQQRFLRRLHRLRPSPTILTAPMIRLRVSHAHPAHNRVISVAETRRLMGVPDWFRLPVPTLAAYRGLGNGVVPPLAKAFAKLFLTTHLRGGNPEYDLAQRRIKATGPPP